MLVRLRNLASTGLFTPLRHANLGGSVSRCRRAPPVMEAALYLLLSPVNRSAAMIGKRVDQGLCSSCNSSLPATQFDSCHAAVAQIPQAIMRLV